MSKIQLNYWVHASGFPEIIYLKIPGGIQIAGHRTKKAFITWKNKDLSQSEIDSHIATHLPDIQGWDELMAAYALHAPKSSSKSPAGGPATRRGTPGWTPADTAARNIPYGPQDTAELDPSKMSHGLPEPTKLLIDHREPETIIAMLRLIPNLDVEVTTLEIGDYLVADRFVIERKTTSDFQTSVAENAKRMFKQTEVMATSGLETLVLVEGGTTSQNRLSLNSIRGTETFISLIQKIPIIQTIDQRDTVYTLAKAIRHVCYGLGYDLGLRALPGKTAKAADPLTRAAYVLQGIPGVSATRARALLIAFGSIRAIACASSEDLQKVNGIGPGTAKTIFDTLGPI